MKKLLQYVRFITALVFSTVVYAAQNGQETQEKPLLESSLTEMSVQMAQQSFSKPSNTVLPAQLKSGIESMSGMSMDNVKVHYNSSQPAQLSAHAYAQGSDTHVGAGQEQHLPHEAWHVVQQAQGRVRPVMQMMGITPVNDDAALKTPSSTVP